MAVLTWGPDQARRLSDLRNSRGWSQSELATCSQLDLSTILNMESENGHPPRRSTAEKISKAFRVSLPALDHYIQTGCKSLFRSGHVLNDAQTTIQGWLNEHVLDEDATQAALILDRAILKQLLREVLPLATFGSQSECSEHRPE